MISSKIRASFPVSAMNGLTYFIEHRGRTVHLLKQRSKAAPKAVKRRKIEIGSLPENYVPPNSFSPSKVVQGPKEAVKFDPNSFTNIQE